MSTTFLNILYLTLIDLWATCKLIEMSKFCSIHLVLNLHNYHVVHVWEATLQVWRKRGHCLHRLQQFNLSVITERQWEKDMFYLQDAIWQKEDTVSQILQYCLSSEKLGNNMQILSSLCKCHRRRLDELSCMQTEILHSAHPGIYCQKDNLQRGLSVRKCLCVWHVHVQSIEAIQVLWKVGNATKTCSQSHWRSCP